MVRSEEIFLANRMAVINGASTDGGQVRHCRAYTRPLLRVQDPVPTRCNPLPETGFGTALTRVE